jgi:RNA polymerase sigma-70 factor (family 1)
LITPSTNTEKELLVLISKGNELAFRRLFDLYNKRLFIFAVEMLKSAADAEEIVQESFTRLWQNRDNLSEIEHPGSYLYRIVRNATIDLMRKTARERKLKDQVWANISQSDNSLEEELLKKESQELIKLAIDQLSEQKQTVYRLSREQNLSQDEIASVTGLSKSRINNIIVEVLKHIKASLEKHSPYLALAFWINAWEKFL